MNLRKTFLKLVSFMVLVKICLGNQEQKNYTNSLKQKAEKRLVDILFNNYAKNLNPSDSVEIKFSLSLNQIVTLIEQEQILVLNVFLDHEWIDPRLKWNPDEYLNISLLRVKSELFWLPDTFIETSADQTGFLLPQKGSFFLLNNRGVVFWSNPLSQMRIRCRMNIIWFPFDEQLCSVAFGSWSFTANYLNYTILNEVVSLNNFTHNKEWSLIGYKPIRREVPPQSDCIPLINIYFSLCIVFSLVSMIWFSILNNLIETEQLPKLLDQMRMYYLRVSITKQDSVHHVHLKQKLYTVKNMSEPVHEFEIIKLNEFKRGLSKNQVKSREKKNRQLFVNFLNKFMFYVFLTFFILLNLFSLYLLPFFFRQSLTLEDEE